MATIHHMLEHRFPDLRHMTVLVADRNQHMRVLYETLLSAFYAEAVIKAENATQAIDVLTSQRIDLLICGWQLAPFDGLDLIRRIRNGDHIPNRTLPILLVSECVTVENRGSVMACGADNVLPKPISMGVLMAGIGRIVQPRLASATLHVAR